jgi:hypothetical protein
MPLSDKTLAEMQAGALTLAIHRGEIALDPGYMEAMIRTQERAKLMKIWEAEGTIRIEHVINPVKPVPGIRPPSYKVIHCGICTFQDIDAEMSGGYPSEILVANIALAISSGEHKKKPEDWKIP